MTALKEENKNYEDLHTKGFFQFIIVPMSDNVKDMQKLSAKSDAPMADFEDKLKIGNLVRKYNPDEIVPRLMLCNQNGEILSMNELDKMLKYADDYHQKNPIDSKLREAAIKWDFVQISNLKTDKTGGLFGFENLRAKWNTLQNEFGNKKKGAEKNESANQLTPGKMQSSL